MKKEDALLIESDKKIKVFPMVIFCIGVLIFLCQWIFRLNFVTIAALLYCCFVSAIITVSVIAKNKLYVWMYAGFSSALFGIISYMTVFGADAGFGAFMSGLAGFSSSEHPLVTGAGSFFTRLLGNLLLAAPIIILLSLLVITVKHITKKKFLQVLASYVLSSFLVLSSIAYVFMTNLRSVPNTVRMWEGQDEYLNSIDRHSATSPNVLIILMDDLGYGDISLNGAIYNTPNIDGIGENGLQMTDFYSSYSVCSPARFACLTGRYPYRGYADNVVYPTANTVSPLAATRVYNSFEMGANCDGMLGDEITIAETFKSAGYKTGCFGKWHLGDYGEYLPTNQGFDYFYGAYSVNDMAPFFHAREENGEYTIVHGTDELRNQSQATEWIYYELSQWITSQVKGSDEPFFAYYATPWPHAPVFVGDDYKGASGMGTYVDCVTEFDAYLGKLFDALESLGELENTIIVLTSDNGPALEGSTGVLRGGKYLAYEGGQKVPFLMRWDKNPGIFKQGEKRNMSATLVDLYPTLTELCGITGDGGKTTFMPTDRVIDGVSFVPVLRDDSVIHTSEHPILHMKREDIKAIQYTVPTESILARDEYKNYSYDVLLKNNFVTFKYFDNMQNDNSAFFDKFRRNWLHILTDDEGENYNRASVYPTIAKEMNDELNAIQSEFKENTRGIIGSP